MKFLIALVMFFVCFSLPAMERTVSTGQRLVRVLNVKISSTGTVTGLDKLHVAATKSATGTYEVTPDKPFVRDVQANVQNVSTACGVKSITETTSKVTIVMAAADLATEKDCGFNLTVFGSDSSDAY